MNSVIVVEGIHDEMKIKSVYPDANVVITNGREISDIYCSLGAHSHNDFPNW